MPTVELRANDVNNSADDVKRLKRYLRVLGKWSGAIDPAFDLSTAQLVSALQDQAKLEGKDAGGNGVVDTKTWSYIFDQLHVSPAFETLLESGALLTTIHERVKAIEGLSTAMTALQNNVGSIKTTVEGASTQIGTISTNFGEVKPKVDSISTNLSEVKLKVDAISTNLGEVKPKVESIGTTLGTVNSNASEIKGTVGSVDSNVKTINMTANALQEARIASAKAETKSDAYYAKIALEEAMAAVSLADRAVELASKATTDSKLIETVRQHRNLAAAQQQLAQTAADNAAVDNSNAEQATTIPAATAAEREARNERLNAEKAAREARHHADNAVLAQKAIDQGEPPPVVAPSSSNWEPLRKLFDLDRRSASASTPSARPSPAAIGTTSTTGSDGNKPATTSTASGSSEISQK